MYSLYTNFDCRDFRKLILVILAQHSPTIDVVHNEFILILFCVCQFHHAHCMAVTVETIEKFIF